MSKNTRKLKAAVVAMLAPVLVALPQAAHAAEKEKAPVAKVVVKVVVLDGKPASLLDLSADVALAL